MSSATKIESLIRAGIQSGTIMSVADIATQFFIEGKQLPTTYSNNNNDEYPKPTTRNSKCLYYDFKRTLRWTIAGLTLHGPYFFMGFSMVDKYFASTGAAAMNWNIVAKKTAIAQFVLFPPYLVGLFGLMGALEQHPNIISKIQHHAPQAFVGGCIYWPIANGINFALVSQSVRVPYLALSAGVWNSYLSWTNNK